MDATNTETKMNDTDRNALAKLALGRILRMAARPTQPGDVEEYERCRAIIMNTLAPATPDYLPNIARDRGKGAAGQW